MGIVLPQCPSAADKTHTQPIMHLRGPQNIEIIPQKVTICRTQLCANSPCYHFQDRITVCWCDIRHPWPFSVAEGGADPFPRCTVWSPGGCCLMGLFCLTDSFWEKHSQVAGKMAGISALANNNALLHMPADTGARRTK